MASKTTTTKIEGMDELIKQLEALPVELQQKVERNALRPAAKMLKESAESKTPVRTGKLKSAFRMTIRSIKGALTAEIVNKSNYAHLIEFGHIMRSHLPKKKIIRVVAARPFMRPALSENSETLISKSRETFIKQLAKIGKVKK
jgi:HK97 gp10 family phage protein